MKKKNLLDIEAEDRKAKAPPLEVKTDSEVPHDDQGHPLILPPEVWQNIVVNFNHLRQQKKRAHKRVDCYGDVAFFNKKNRVVGIGEMRTLSKNGASFEIVFINSQLKNIAYLEFHNLAELALTQSKVGIRNGQFKGKKLFIGVEFLEPTLAFQEKVEALVAAKLGEMGHFEELEDI